MEIIRENMVVDREGWKGRTLVADPTRVGWIKVKIKNKIKYIDTITRLSH